MILDTHVHFWRYTSQEYDWIADDMAVIRRDYLPGDYPGQAVVAVQARQSIEETDWLLSLQPEHEFIRGVVGWLPLASDGLVSMLDARPRLHGLRHVLQSEPPAFFADPAFNCGLAVLARYQRTYDLLITEAQLPQTIELVDRHPTLRLVVDHLAKPDLSGPTPAWRRGMAELARRDNVTCKISGGITEADLRWRPEQMLPYFDVALEAFTPLRLMFGSNWPVCEAGGGYQRWTAAVEEWARQLSDSERRGLFGATAARVYRLEDA